MNRFHSIRWRLQLWYGLLLLLVLAGLGLAAYELERAKLYRGADQGLMRRVNVLASALHNPRHPPRHGRPGEFAPPDGPSPGGPGEEPGDAPPPRQFGGPFDGQPGFRLPVRDQALFDLTEPNGFYYVIFDREGGQIAASTNAPTGIEPPSPPSATPESAPPGEPTSDAHRPTPPPRGNAIGGTPHNRDNYREIFVTTPPGDTILVGHNIQPELSELRRAAITLAAVGCAILSLALAVGYWLVARALQPIETIGATATRIATGDLAQRIDLAETESELGRLAAVLNATFARLETAFNQQQQFAANAAHELRTPVTVILTQTQMALARERSPADYRQTLEACQRAAQRMRRLIESLLELTRFDAGQESLKRLPFDLAATARDAADLVTPLAQAQGLELTLDVEPLVVTGDSERLAQVLLNLLTNAITYNRPQGKVRLHLRAAEGLAVLEVSDTGQGIAPEDLPRVFERFYRGDASRTGSANTGLGLAICKAIVEAHGGTLEATSELGQGSTFTVRLPR